MNGKCELPLAASFNFLDSSYRIHEVVLHDALLHEYFFFRLGRVIKLQKEFLNSNLTSMI